MKSDLQSEVKGFDISRFYRHPVVISLVVFIILFSAGLILVESERASEIGEQRSIATGLAATEVQTIRGQLDRSLSSTLALASIIRQGRGEIDDFDSLAEDIIQSYGGISSLQLAPGAVLNQIYPLEGNEAAIGHDLLADPNRRTEALLAIESGDLTLAGPFELIQGGTAIIGRLPVYIPNPETGEEEFWGFTIALIKMDDFLPELGFETIEQSGYDYLLYRNHPDTGVKQVFARSSDNLFTSPVTQSFNVPNGQWNLALMPRAGWSSGSTTLMLLVALVSILISGSTYLVLKQNILLDLEVSQRLEEISQRKQFEAKLRESEQQALAISDSSMDAIIVVDEEGVITYWNPAATKMFEYTMEEVMGRKIHEFMVSDEARKKYYKKLPIFGKTGKCDVIGKTLEVTAIKKDGRKIPLEVSISAFQAPGMWYSVGILRDITDRKQREDKINKYSQALEESNKLKDLFIDIMRHDLLNSIGIIRGESEYYFEEETNQDKKESFQTMFRSSQNAIDIIENASILASLEGKDALELKTKDLNTYLRDAISEVNTSASANNVEITLSTPKTLKAKSNPLILDVFLNILTNAVKYGPENTTVKVEVKIAKDTLQISFSDNGPGIPDKFKQNIFDRFKRIKKEGVTGTGLGLAIAKKIVELHNGKIWIEDQPGGGSIFVIELPSSL